MQYLIARLALAFSVGVTAYGIASVGIAALAHPVKQKTEPLVMIGPNGEPLFSTIQVVLEPTR